MNADTEQSDWRRQWQSSTRDWHGQGFALDLAQRVARQSRRQIIGLIFPVLVTAVIGGGLIIDALRDPQPVDVALAIEGWVFILAVWACSIWLARNTWRPLAETTEAFLDLSIRRCRANIRGIFAAIVFCIVQFFAVFGVFAVYTDAAIGELLDSSPVAILGGVGIPLAIVIGSWFIRQQRAQLRKLEQMRRELKKVGGAGERGPG